MIALKRGFLIGMLVLIGLAALACVGLLLMGSGRTEQQTALLTAITWGYCMLQAFGAFYVLEKGNVILRIGAGAALIAIAICVLAMPPYFWWEQHWYGWYATSRRGPPATALNLRELLSQLSQTLLVATGWLTFTPWVLTPRMTWGKIVQGLTAASLTAGLIIVLVTTWGRIFNPKAETATMVAFIVSGAGALSVLVINKFLGIKVPDVLTSVSQRIWMRCPRCLKEQEITAGECRCTGCKLLFKLEVEEPRCGKCGYNLFQLTTPVCPECGNNLRLD